MTTSQRHAALTDRGRVSDHNEDAYAVEDDLWVVADGMGGHAGGEVASQVAVDAVVRMAGGGAVGRSEDVRGLLEDAVAAARGAVVDRARQDPVTAGMGTTLVVAARGADGQLVVAWVGDSRAYLLVDGELVALTSDHNVAQEMVDLGMITLEQARTHPGQYRITRAITDDLHGDATPGVAVVPATGRLLLCSDGLNGELDDARIATLLADQDPGTATRALVHEALDAGGRDNVTVVVVDL